MRRPQVPRARIGAALALALTLATGVAAGALSPPIVQKGKLRASDGAKSDVFGTSVAISGNTIVVTAPGKGLAGAAYVFTRPGRGWANGTQTAKLTPSDGAGGDSFGSSVAISGDTIVVGAPFDGNHGSAYAFERPVGGWANSTEDAKLTPSDTNATFDFGRSVSVSGNSVLVGAEQSTVNGHSEQGSAYAFVRPPGGWINRNENAKLFAAGGAANDFFGRSVAISDDTAVLGAPGRNVAGNTPNRGAVYVFVAPAGADTWKDTDTPTATLVASEGALGDFLGFSVAISGSTLVAGAMQDDMGLNNTQGSAYVFERPPGGWSDVIESTKLIASDGGAGDRLGFSAAIFGDSVVLGTSHIGTEDNQGAAYLFGKPAAGWPSAAPRTESAKLVAADGRENDRFGGAVTVSADTIATGALGDDFDSETEQGSAYVFGSPKRRSRVTLRIAKTNRRVRARGRVTPPRSGERVVVKLYRKRAGRFRRVAAKRPGQRDTGRYRASFTRRAPGGCKIVARYLGDPTTASSRASKRFSC